MTRFNANIHWFDDDDDNIEVEADSLDEAVRKFHAEWSVTGWTHGYVYESDHPADGISVDLERPLPDAAGAQKEGNTATPAVPVQGETGEAEALARQFHETYERLAPEFNYSTRIASAVPWEDVPANNKALMIAVAKSILLSLTSTEGGTPDV